MGPPPGGEASSYYNTTTTTTTGSRDVNVQQQQDENTWYGRVTGMVRRTPSPEQFFDSARKGVMGGMAAAGAALGSIMEDSDEQDDRGVKRRTERRDLREEREGFSDHERWSEEADGRERVSAVEAESERRAENARSLRDEKGKGRTKKAVAVVVSADTSADIYDEDENAGYTTEHAVSHPDLTRGKHSS